LSAVCKVKVNCALLQALRHCAGRTTYRGSRGIALLFHDRGTRRGWVVSRTPRPHFTPGKNPVPILQEAGWAPGPVWTGAENLVTTGIRSPDRPARSSVAIPTELSGPYTCIYIYILHYLLHVKYILLYIIYILICILKTGSNQSSIISYPTSSLT
jgi:hypothetical protein